MNRQKLVKQLKEANLDYYDLLEEELKLNGKKGPFISECPV